MNSREEFSSLMFAVGKVYLSMGQLAQRCRVPTEEVPPHQHPRQCYVNNLDLSKCLAVAEHPHTLVNVLGPLFMGLLLKGGQIESGLTARNQPEASYMGICFVQGSVFHVICVCNKCCQLPAVQAAQYLQRNQTRGHR